MNARSLLLAVASVMGMAVSAAGQTATVKLEWDPNTEASLAGYIVYVGNASGSYQEQYDAGLQTSFVYTNPIPGRLYFFSVAAYALGPQVGPRSDEVLFLTGVETSFSPSGAGLEGNFEGNVKTERSASAAAARSSAPGTVCLGDGCCRVDLVASVAGQARALAHSADGRLFFIEDGKYVRVIQDGSLVPQPALSADASAALMGFVLDPGFADTGFVYVGVTQQSAGGGRELDIVRYREVANTLGEGAVIVAGLPLPANGDASLALDAVRRLYVAMPAAPGSDARTARYAGMLLRFESSGVAVQDDGAGAPVFSAGYAQPTSLTWTGAGNALWLAGTGADGVGSLTRLPLTRGSAEPAAPESVAIARGRAIVSVTASMPAAQERSETTALAAVIVVDEQGNVFQIAAAPGGDADTTRWIVPDELGGRAVSAVGSASGNDIYLAVTRQTQSESVSTQIIRLRRQ